MTPTTPRPGRATATVARATVAVVAAVALAAGLAAAWLTLTGEPAEGSPPPLKGLAMTAVWLVPGVLVSVRRPRLALGWLALGEALLFAAAALGDAWARYGEDGAPGLGWAVWLTDRFSAFLVVGALLMLLLLPDGRLPGPRWRPVVAVVVAAQVLLITGFATVRGPAAGPDTSLPARVRDVPNPVGVLPADLGETLAGLDAVVLQLPLLLCLAAFVARLRRADPDERVRVVGVLLAASTFVLLVVLGHAWLPPAAEALDVLAGALLAAELTATVLGRRPAVVAALVRQAFVFTVLTAAVGGLALLVDALLERLGQDLPVSGVAVVAAAAALALQPLRARLGRAVDRLLFGDVADPYRALQRLAERTHRAPDLDGVLAGLAASVAASLRVPWSRVQVDGHVGTWGLRPPGEESCADLVSGAAVLGSVAVVPGAGRRLRADELRLLADLGRHGGVAVQAVLLSDALRAGRQRIVVAREEERRRLRRDLHDEVGPTLAGLTMQLGAVRPLVHSEPEAAADRLVRLQDAAREALETVRRLAHGLRPPALDELGVAGALRQLADSLGLPARFPDPDPPRLPAAVEVAAYRIGAEALHNVARHAGPADVEVGLRTAGTELVLTVRDTGAGIGGTHRAGVGLAAMRERADELGGSLQVDSRPRAGTTITARLPAQLAEPEPALP
jgi:signal transduction histidine kinase